MALASAFRERLENMERARNERLSLLQAEKDLQAKKSDLLSLKLANIRSMEQRCLMLDQNVASRNFKISSLKSEIERLDAKYLADSQQLRVLKSEVAEVEEMEKEKERFYEVKGLEMKEFREYVNTLVVEARIKVEELRNKVHELESTFLKLQGNNNEFLSNTEIAVAEMTKAQLLAEKESLDKSLASNYQVRSHLQKQLQYLITQNKGMKHIIDNDSVQKC